MSSGSVILSIDLIIFCFSCLTLAYLYFGPFLLISFRLLLQHTVIQSLSCQSVCPPSSLCFQVSVFHLRLQFSYIISTDIQSTQHVRDVREQWQCESQHRLVYIYFVQLFSSSLVIRIGVEVIASNCRQIQVQLLAHLHSYRIFEIMWPKF